jgi:hypothetical protein
MTSSADKWLRIARIVASVCVLATCVVLWQKTNDGAAGQPIALWELWKPSTPAVPVSVSPASATAGALAAVYKLPTFVVQAKSQPFQPEPARHESIVFPAPATAVQSSAQPSQHFAQPDGSSSMTLEFPPPEGYEILGELRPVNALEPRKIAVAQAVNVETPNLSAVQWPQEEVAAREPVMLKPMMGVSRSVSVVPRNEMMSKPEEQQQREIVQLNPSLGSASAIKQELVWQDHSIPTISGKASAKAASAAVVHAEKAVQARSSSSLFHANTESGSLLYVPRGMLCLVLCSPGSNTMALQNLALNLHGQNTDAHLLLFANAMSSGGLCFDTCFVESLGSGPSISRQEDNHCIEAKLSCGFTAGIAAVTKTSSKI